MNMKFYELSVVSNELDKIIKEANRKNR